MLLAPERVIEAEGPASEILKRCDGARTLGAIIDELAARVRRGPGGDRGRRQRAAGGARGQASDWVAAMTAQRPSIQFPLGLFAELTHRCPLACPYCSNPLALENRAGELTSDEWARVFRRGRGARRAASPSLRRRALRPARYRRDRRLRRTRRGSTPTSSRPGSGSPRSACGSSRRPDSTTFRSRSRTPTAESADRIAGYQGAHAAQTRGGAAWSWRPASR